MSQDRRLFRLGFFKYSEFEQLFHKENYSLIYENEYDIYAKSGVSLDVSKILVPFNKANHIIQKNRVYGVTFGKSYLLSVPEYENLVKKVSSSNFFALKDRYDAYVDDVGGTILTVNTGSALKTVREWGGGDAPKGFDQISNQLEEL